jgi:predicted transcriptional regulator
MMNEIGDLVIVLITSCQKAVIMQIKLSSVFDMQISAIL